MPIVGVHDAPDVLTVIPTLGHDIERLSRCVDSIASGTGQVRVAVLCVVNSSTVAPFALDGCTVEVTGLNLGWAGGLHFGAALVDAPLIWFMQDDVVVEPDTLTALHAALEREPGLGAAGPVAVDEAGMVDPYSCGARLSADGVFSEWYPSEACAPSELTGLDTLSYLPSRGMLVRRSAFDAVKGPNPRLYPVQFVDVDFSARLRAAGWGFRMIPEARVRHGQRGSTPGAFAEFLLARNEETFRQDWFAEASVTVPGHFVGFGGDRPDPVDAVRQPLHPQLDPALLAVVAQSAADTLTHLGRVYSAARRESPET